MDRAPATLPWAVGGLALLVVLGLAGVARAFAAGVGLAVRDRIHVGDRIEVGSLRGRVERVGLLSVRIARPDGAVAYLPAHRLAGEAVEVAHARRGTPLEWRFLAPRPLTADDRRQLHDLLVLSPYRDSAGQPGIFAEPGGEVRLVLPVWAPTAVPAATAWLDARLGVFAERLGPASTPTEPGATEPPNG
ncbi:MAG: mechanosensitive ion channel [bacterium]